MSDLLDRYFEKISSTTSSSSLRSSVSCRRDDPNHKEIPTIEISSYSSLVRVAGYLKYNIGKTIGTQVLFRGQRHCYAQPGKRVSLPPSSYRTLTEANRRIYENHLRQFLVAFRRDRETDETKEQLVTTEPSLQHYGIRTRWIDVVDSIPHALFFAVHEFPENGGAYNCIKAQPANEGYCYILVVVLRNLVQTSGGFWKSASAELCDLRCRKTSLMTRPHAQHGLLFRDRLSDNAGHRVAAQLALPLGLASTWIGGDCFHPTQMFPPKSEDPYYGSLLKKNRRILEIASCVASGFSPGTIHSYSFHRA